MNERFFTGAAARIVAVVALTAVLAACNRGDDEQAAATATPAVTGAAADAAATPAESPDDERMGNAVAAGKVGAAVDLKYDVLVKPDVGQPFEVELALLPRLAADALEVEVTGIPGLTVVSGGASRFEGVSAGERYLAKVLVQADAPGIYYVNVVAKTITEVLTEARTFSVPLVVGALPAAQKVEPAKDASGEAIRSLPAEESGGPAPPPR